MNWKNRIVGYADVAPSELLANPRNFRIHPKNQQDALTAVIDEVGFVSPVIVRAGTDTVIDGHLRVTLAMRSNQKTIPVTYVDLSESEEALILATFDPLSAMAVSDAQLLRELLEDVSTGDAALQSMLSELAEREGIIPPDTFDPNSEWQGMPEFDNGDAFPMKQVTINFASVADVERFARLMEQNITMKTKSIWYPAKNLESIRDKAYVSATS